MILKLLKRNHSSERLPSIYNYKPHFNQFFTSSIYTFLHFIMSFMSACFKYCSKLLPIFYRIFYLARWPPFFRLVRLASWAQVARRVLVRCLCRRSRRVFWKVFCILFLDLSLLLCLNGLGRFCLSASAKTSVQANPTHT